MPLYPTSKPRPGKRRSVTLPIFRGVPRLRRLVEAQLRKAIMDMQHGAATLALDPGLTARGKAELLAGLLDQWRGKFAMMADDLARRMVEDTSQASKNRFMAEASKAMGIPVAAVFDTPEMRAQLDTAAVAAASWIKSIPEQHIGKVAAATLTAMQQGQQPEGRTLAQQIEHIGDVSRKRARFIARDQLHKINSDVLEAQARALDSDGYIWHCNRDERCVGNPTGLYPVGSKMHGDHYHREGKFFRWDKPPADGHNPIGCRCFKGVQIDFAKAIRI
jgi:uncharacterized protein with gpF-like domain